MSTLESLRRSIASLHRVPWRSVRVRVDRTKVLAISALFAVRVQLPGQSWHSAWVMRRTRDLAMAGLMKRLQDRARIYHPR